MADNPQAAELSGEAITARVPRILRYMADVIDASEAGDTGYQIEAPSDLPMDASTFAAVMMLVTDLADAAGVNAGMLREQAATIEAAL